MLIPPLGWPSKPSRFLDQSAVLLRGATVISLLVLSACGGSSGGDGGGSTTPPTSTTTVPTLAAVTQPTSYVLLSFVDSQTGSPIEDELSVNLSGPGVAQAVDGVGAALTQFKTTTGFSSFALKSTAVPSASAPVLIQLGIVSKQYLASGSTVSIADAGETALEIRLVRTSFDATGALTGAAAGVTGKQEIVAASANGALASNSANGSYTLAVPATAATVAVVNSDGVVENVAAPTASISVPAGVLSGRTVRNSAGVDTFVPAAAGPVTARVVAFSPQSTAALSSFPGGFTVLPSAGGGVTEAAEFQSAGFAAFEFSDSAGNPVDKFSGPITLTTEAPATTVTPSGALLSVGSVIPMWSYNASIAEWKSEGSGTVTGKAANGNWTVTFQATHLSYWNMDYYGRSCTARINIIGRQGDARPLVYSISAEGGQFWYGSAGPDIDNVVEILRTPSDMRLTITALDYSLGTPPAQVGKITRVSACGTAAINLPVVLPARPAPRIINVNTTEACADGTNRRPVATPVFGSGTSSYGYFSFYTNGAGSGAVSFNQTAVFRVYAYDPRTQNYVSQILPALISGTQNVNFQFTMPCTLQPRPTGATGGTSGGSGST